MEQTIHLSKNRIIYELSLFLGEEDPGKIESFIYRTLEQIAELLEAQRAIIFLNNRRLKNFSALWEWYDAGTVPALPRLQELGQHDYKILGKSSEKDPWIMVTDTERIPDSYPNDSKLFRNMNCKSFFQRGFIHHNSFIGSVCFFYDRIVERPNTETIEFLQITGELLKTLVLKTNYFSRISKVAAFKGVSPLLAKKLTAEPYDIPLLFNKILDDLNYGISIYDTSSQTFLFANPVFRDLLAITQEKQIRPKDVFTIFSKNGYDFDDFFSRGSARFVKDFTLQHRNRYLAGNVSPVRNTEWLVMSAADITPIANYEKTEKLFNQQLKVISESAIELIVPGQNMDDVFRFVGEAASRLAEDAIVILSKYNSQDEYLQTVYLHGLGYYMDSVAKMIGKHPLKKKYPLRKDSEAYKEMMALKAKEIANINELTFGAIPAPVAKKLQKVLNVERFFSCAIFSEDKLFGTIVFLMRPGKDLNLYILETFSRLISNALDAMDIGSKLSKTTRVLSHAANIARISYWEFDFQTSEFLIGDKLFNKFEHRFDQQAQSDEVRLPLIAFLERYVTEETRIRILEMIKNAKQNKNLENYVSEIEFSMQTSLGQNMHIYARGVNQKGDKMMGIVQDVSELKRAEKKLWESELKFQNLVEQSMDGIVVVQDDGIITEWNPRAEEISDMQAGDVMGKYAWEVESALIFDPDTNNDAQQKEAILKKRFFKFFHSAFSRKPFSSEVLIKVKNGEVRHLSVTSFVFTANQRKFLCRISRDITAEKLRLEKEKQEEINHKTAKAKDLFLDNMSHEMRTPLSGIIGMTDILMHTSLSSQQSEMLGVVKESSDSLLELISNIHELSRLESEGVIIYNNPFRMAVMMEKTNSIFKAAALQRSIQLEFVDETPENLRLIGDEFRLRQVLGNLTGNAIKFTPPGGKVEVSAHCSVKEGNRADIKITVKDTGIGIDKNKIPELFNKFTQVDSSYTREYDGVGIGLPISRELVKLMGGTIEVHSEPRHGSTFTVCLELACENDAS